MSRSRAGTLLALGIMCLGAALMIYPYLYAVGGSFKTRAEFAADKRSVIPPRYQPATLYQQVVGGERDAESEKQRREWPIWRNYVDAIRYGEIDRYLCNSLFYAVLVTAFSLFFNVLAAYAFARMEFPGRDLLFGMLLSTMMIPSAVLLVPQFLVVQ